MYYIKILLKEFGPLIYYSRFSLISELNANCVPKGYTLVHALCVLLISYLAKRLPEVRELLQITYFW